MSTSLKFTVGGRDYTNDIQGGVKAMFKEAMEQKLKRDLGPILDEIESEGGEVIIDLDGGMLSFKNCSDQLIAKIKEAIKQ